MTERVKLLTFNILAPCWASPQWYASDLNVELLDRNYRRNRIIDVISASSADVVCLQEVTDIEFSAIKSTLNYFVGFMSHNDASYWSNWIVEDTPWEPNGCAILVRKSKFESIQFEDRALSDTGNHAVRFSGRLKNTNKDIVVWSIHLDSDKAQNRKREAESLVAQVGPGAEIIAGDFNIDYESSNIKHPLSSAGFSNALRTVGNFEPTHPFSSQYYHSHTFAKIDHILVRGPTPIFGDVLDYGFWSITNETKRIEATLEQTGSDHFPVVVTVTI